MHIKLFGAELIDVATVNKLKAAAEAAGHTVVVDETSAVETAFNSLTTAFPQLEADIKQGIADLKDSTLSGGDKAVKVASDVISSLPDVVKALPELKSVVVSGVTKLFAATETSIVDGVETFVKTVQGASSTGSATAAADGASAETIAASGTTAA